MSNYNPRLKEANIIPGIKPRPKFKFSEAEILEFKEYSEAIDEAYQRGRSDVVKKLAKIVKKTGELKKIILTQRELGGHQCNVDKCIDELLEVYEDEY